MHTYTGFLDTIGLLFWSALPLSGAILALYWAANHTWISYEEGRLTVKGLILHPVKNRIDVLMSSLDSYRFARICRDVMAVAVAASGVMMAMYPQPPLSGLSWLLLTASMLFFRKRWVDIGVFILGCYRCMPTFWVALPVILYTASCGVSGVLSQSLDPHLGITLPYVLFLAVCTSFWTTSIQSVIDVLSALVSSLNVDKK